MPFRLDPDDRTCVQKQNEDGSWKRVEGGCQETVEDAKAQLAALRINVDESVTQITETFDRGFALDEQSSVDRSENTVKNVRLLGRQSDNGRVYSEKAIRDAVTLYSGAPVFLDHPTRRELRQRDGSRSVRDLAGKVRNPRQTADGVRGDVEVLSEGPDGSFLLALANQMPDMVGMSHRAEGKLKRQQDGPDMVEEIEKVHAVELVSDPATTEGLFESIETESEGEDPEGTMPETEALQERIDDLKEQVEDLEEKNDELQNDLDEAQAELAERDHQDVVEEKLGEADLPDRVVTDQFRESLLNAEDEDEVDALLEDRQTLVEELRSDGGPTSSEHDSDELFEGEDGKEPVTGDSVSQFLTEARL